MTKIEEVIRKTFTDYDKQKQPNGKGSITPPKIEDYTSYEVGILVEHIINNVHRFIVKRKEDEPQNKT